MQTLDPRIVNIYADKQCRSVKKIIICLPSVFSYFIAKKNLPPRPPCHRLPGHQLRVVVKAWKQTVREKRCKVEKFCKSGLACLLGTHWNCRGFYYQKGQKSFVF